MSILVEIIGWAGTVAILLAYWLVSNKKVSPTGYFYQGLNLFGAIGLIINVGYHGAWPGVGLNIVWAIIAALALLQCWRGWRARQQLGSKESLTS